MKWSFRKQKSIKKFPLEHTHTRTTSDALCAFGPMDELTGE